MDCAHRGLELCSPSIDKKFWSCCSIIEQTCLGCRQLVSRYILWQLIVFAVAIVAVVKADCQFFTAVDIVVITATVVAVYSSSLPSWGGWRQLPSLPLQGRWGKGASSNTIVGEGKGGGLFPPYCHLMGGMTPNVVAAAARGIMERGIFWRHRGRGRREGLFSLPIVLCLKVKGIPNSCYVHQH